MREAHIPVLIEREDLPSVSSILHERFAVAPEHIALGKVTGNTIQDLTTSEFYHEVRSVAAGLVSVGVRPNEAVAIMSPTCYKWSVASFAIWEAGAVLVPIYDTASVLQAEKIIAACNIRFAFVRGKEERTTIENASDDCQIWSFNTDSGHDLSLLVEQGQTEPDNHAELDRRVAGTLSDDLASIVFTSGTNGGSKGVRITHGNFVRLVLQVAGEYKEVVNEKASTIVFLPLAHVLAQGLQLVSVYAGMKIVHESKPQAAIALLGKVQPSFLVVVPRILEKIRFAARAEAHNKKLSRLFSHAERTAVTWGEYLERNQRDPSTQPRLGLRIGHRIYDHLFYRRIRAVLGGNIDYLLSGASPLDSDLGNFFRGIAVPVVEGYGLTETTAPIAANRIGHMRAGSVGTPLPGSTIRISKQGEILVKGVGVTTGYLDPTQNENAFEDGFFRTGDIGTLDQDGFLRIGGRLKNILVTAYGKNIAPEPWERTVCTNLLIAHAVVVGEAKPYAAALIVLDVDETLNWSQTQGMNQLVDQIMQMRKSKDAEMVEISNEILITYIQRIVDKANATVSRAEQVRKFVVLIATLSEQQGTLTPTQKLRRKEFLNRATAYVSNMYENNVKNNAENNTENDVQKKNES